jgi:lantibiotic modifying enzyme
MPEYPLPTTKNRARIMSKINISEAVDSISTRIITSRYERDGKTGWLSFDTDDHRHPGSKIDIQSSPGVYSGRLGVAIYLAAIESTEGDWSSLQMDTETLFNDLGPTNIQSYTQNLGLGIEDGVGSVVYGLSLLSELTGDEQHSETAQAVARTLSHQQIKSTEVTNVLSGLAGAIHGLCKLYETDASDVGLTRAIRCGERLLEVQYPKWGTTAIDTHPGSVTTCSTGMGRGAAGVAHALYRLYGHTGRTEFRDAADDVLVFERAFYQPSRHNWLANWNDVPNFRLWWSQGTPGIGLARIGSLDEHSADLLRDDLSCAAGYTPRISERDSLCHGTFSQVSFLIELSRYHGESCDDARQLAARAIRRRQSEQGYRLVGAVPKANPSLFLGLAGIGYTLLRLSAPNQLPSIGRLE